MTMYKITQLTTKKRLFFGTKEIETVFTFDDYNSVLLFALNEQIKDFKHIVSESVQSNRKTFERLYTCKQWVKLAHTNPIHYIGLQSSNGVNLERLYYYYINSHKIQYIQKHI